MHFIDMRSDTITLPTQDMREAIYNAVVGDDVYGEDPTINELEQKTAKLLGKEAALFVTSGTQGNQLAVMTHTRPGDEVILEEKCHILTYEVGGIGYLAGVQAKILTGDLGVMDPREIALAIRERDIHQPETRLICLENTHNRAGGTVVPMEILRETFYVGQDHKIPVHMDGARVFNAATYLQVPVKEIAQYTDSIMVCLSKGLGAPVGSILAGTSDFIKKARRYRKMLGGGMRQGGFLAAAGIVALDTRLEGLAKDHENARQLALGLASIPGIEIDLDTVQTNIVLCDISGLGMTGSELSRKLLEKAIKVNGGQGPWVRFVTHHQVQEEDIHYLIDVIKTIAL